MKKLLLLLAFFFIGNVLFAAVPDSTDYSKNVFNIVPYEESFVFSSMDWYNTIIVYNINTNQIVEKINVKREAKKQLSQMVFVSYLDWGFGEYVVVAKKGKHKKECRFTVRETYVILVCD